MNLVDPELNENINEFIQGILAACEARDNAKWTDMQRKARHERLHAVIIKELEKENKINN